VLRVVLGAITLGTIAWTYRYVASQRRKAI
jgi:hypothetical protein